MAGMTGTIKVSQDKLIQTAEAFGTENGKISGYMSEMMNIITGLASSWQGDASTAYITKFKSLESDIQTINRMIQEHVSDLEQMAQTYSSAEQQNVDDSESLPTTVL